MQRSFCIILMLFMHTLQTHAQNGRVAWDEVGFVYAQEKFQRTYRTYLETYGEYVSPLEPVRFPVASDSLFGWIRQAMGMPDPSLSRPFQGEIHAWTLASIDGRIDWLAQFGNVQWAYLGNGIISLRRLTRWPRPKYVLTWRDTLARLRRLLWKRNKAMQLPLTRMVSLSTGSWSTTRFQ